VLFWTAFDDLETDLAEAANNQNADGLAGALGQTLAGGLLFSVTSLVSMAAGAIFLVWLWQARENTEVISPSARHRLSKGWVIGSWFCPAVQFWFPLTIVDDIYRASAAPDRPGTVIGTRGRGVVYRWWAAWALYWLCILVGSVLTLVTLISWLVWVSEAEQRGGVEEVRVRTDVVRFVHWVAAGLGTASGLLVIAAALVCLVIRRITKMQDTRGPVAQLPGLQPHPAAPWPVQPPGYGQQSYPAYGRPQDRPPGR
jgi:Domain of unknown function (DUF4328)